ncbi:LysM peptidoglycan-binding domain-containing protein [Neptuniibacter sp. PT8_73]|uniref:LysM peptidoglycan-binding domain-containing protein n=1 Tax=Neptuniibacter sp. PT8_73 TaxID=3398206 RepID=UPI0039F50B2E
MSGTYEIIEGDCLELIAKRLGITVGKLQAMNSEQIKNVDLIYAGNLINIPDDKDSDTTQKTAKPSQNEVKPAAVSSERIQLPELPKQLGDVCEPREYVDVVFYPSMPKTGQQGWFAITQQAKDKLIEEIVHMRSIMQAMLGGDVNDAMMELSKYGILSKFQSSDHERFLEQQEDKDRYRALLFLQLALKLEVLSVPKILFNKAHNGEELGKEFYGEYSEAFEKEKLWQHCINALNVTFKGGMQVTPLRRFVDAPTKEDTKLRYQEIRREAIDDVMEQLADEIEKLEKKARLAAKKKASDDGTPFVYSEKMGYFTSKQQYSIHNALANVHKARGMYSLELEDICSDSPKSIQRRLELWQHDSTVASRLSPYEFRARFAGRFTPIFTLNTNLMVLIEQCLTDDDLLANHPSTFKYYEKLDEAAEKKMINEVFSLIPKLESMDTVSGQALPWSYYPCVALLHKLEASLKAKMVELKDLLGVGKLPKEVLGDLVHCKKALLAQVTYYQEKAKTNAAAQEYQRLFTSNDKLYTPVFKEKEWKPAKKTGSLYTDAGKADLSVVECYLSSEEGRVAYVRGPSWLIPEDSQSKIECGDHFLDLKGGLRAADSSRPMAKNNYIEGGEPIPEPEEQTTRDTFLDNRVKDYITKLSNELPIKANFKNQLLSFDKAMVKWAYEWKPDGPEIDETAYHVSSECQFLRFSSAVSMGDQIGASQLTERLQGKNIKFGLVDANAELNLAKGQSTLTVQYPSATGHPFKIHYIAYLPAKPLKIEQEVFYRADRKEQNAVFDGGNIMLQGKFTLYGMVGASVNLGASVEFGNLDQGGLGVKGFTESYQGYNAHRKDVAQIKNADGELLAPSKAADITASAGVFAGVEAGGEFVGSLNWQKPNSKGFVSFGEFTAKAAGAFAASASGVIKLTVSGGKIIFIMAAKLALGPGVGGKVGFEISPLAINDFIDHILTIMDQEGFRRISLFDESIDPESGENSFELFNMFLTAVMVTGLKAADVLLLPFEQIQAFNDEKTREKLAPVLADFINNEAEVALPWVKKMPPETLGRLLYTLTDKQTYSFGERTSDLMNMGGNPRLVLDQNRDVRQRNAFERILVWLVNGHIKGDDIAYSSELSGKQRRYFEETLTRMSGKGQKPGNYKAEWQALLGNLRRMIYLYESAIWADSDTELNQSSRTNKIYSFRGLLNMLTRDYQFYVEKGYLGDSYTAIYIGDCKSDVIEQNARKNAVDINPNCHRVSVMDIEGKA